MNEAPIDYVLTLEDLVAMLLDIEHFLFVKLEIILRLVVHVTRLSDEVSGHLVRYKLLSTVECGQGRESSQTLTLYELD